MMERIIIAGGQERERYWLTRAFSLMCGYDLVMKPSYFYLAGKYGLVTELNKCEWPESFVYCLGAFIERISIEQQYGGQYVSDGGGFCELAWLQCRYTKTELVYEWAMIDALEKVVMNYLKGICNVIFHLEPDDLEYHKCLIQLYEKYSIPYRIITKGTPEERLSEMASSVKAKQILSPWNALSEAGDH